jgi:hypothetical protein
MAEGAGNRADPSADRITSSPDHSWDAETPFGLVDREMPQSRVLAYEAVRPIPGRPEDRPEIRRRPRLPAGPSPMAAATFMIERTNNVRDQYWSLGRSSPRRGQRKILSAQRFQETMQP